MNKETMERDWDRRAIKDAECYIADGYQGNAFFEEGHKLAYELTSGFFQAKDFHPKGKRMLDIGCGIGRLERGFSELFGEVHGLDVSGEMIKRAIELNSALNNVEFVKGNGQDLAVFPDEYFDFVFSYITFQHIPEKRIILNYLSEINRVLKKGGLFKVLLRRQWNGFAFAFGFIPIPRFLFPYIPSILWEIYTRLAPTEEERLRRSSTYRGSGMKENEAKQALIQLEFNEIEINKSQSKYTFWVCGKKPDTLGTLV